MLPCLVIRSSSLAAKISADGESVSAALSERELRSDLHNTPRPRRGDHAEQTGIDQAGRILELGVVEDT